MGNVCWIRGRTPGHCMLYVPASLKQFLFGSLQKKFADPGLVPEALWAPVCPFVTGEGRTGIQFANLRHPHPPFIIFSHIHRIYLYLYIF